MGGIFPGPRGISLWRNEDLPFSAKILAWARLYATRLTTFVLSPDRPIAVRDTQELTSSGISIANVSGFLALVLGRRAGDKGRGGSISAAEESLKRAAIPVPLAPAITVPEDVVYYGLLEPLRMLEIEEAGDQA